MTCTTTSLLVSYLYPDQPSANSQPLARGRSLAEYRLLASGLVVVQVADQDLPLGGSLGAGHRLLVMVQAASRVQVSTLTGGRPVAGQKQIRVAGRLVANHGVYRWSGGHLAGCGADCWPRAGTWPATDP